MLASTALGDDLANLWKLKLTLFEIGGFHLEESLLHWVNDDHLLLRCWLRDLSFAWLGIGGAVTAVIIGIVIASIAAGLLGTGLLVPAANQQPTQSEHMSHDPIPQGEPT